MLGKRIAARSVVKIGYMYITYITKYYITIRKNFIDYMQVFLLVSYRIFDIVSDVTQPVVYAIVSAMKQTRKPTRQGMMRKVKNCIGKVSLCIGKLKICIGIL